MTFLFLLLGIAVVGVLVWRTIRAGQSDLTTDREEPVDQPWSTATRPAPPRASGPDDDPDFLRQLDKKVRGGDDDQPAG